MRGCDNDQGLITFDGGGAAGLSEECGEEFRRVARGGAWWRMVAQLPDKILR